MFHTKKLVVLKVHSALKTFIRNSLELPSSAEYIIAMHFIDLNFTKHGCKYRSRSVITISHLLCMDDIKPFRSTSPGSTTRTLGSHSSWTSVAERLQREGRWSLQKWTYQKNSRCTGQTQVPGYPKGQNKSMMKMHKDQPQLITFRR